MDHYPEPGFRHREAEDAQMAAIPAREGGLAAQLGRLRQLADYADGVAKKATERLSPLFLDGHQGIKEAKDERRTEPRFSPICNEFRSTLDKLQRSLDRIVESLDRVDI